ncbi:hypothetical protein N7509_000121 [Penicillium cosmopolitanum]|uniref:MACPF domain-containing protein n=1 Tax=Penicillium cosmopolitanum TaxID=1131564 RepID=A0A9X0BFE2_9EURO|nr:uncharacterized protein N7509_000121 [Penicillium cosmopolitanum]KAJ5415023.1 hypothetical protein N7509_000121 [Penicillium cosmopolitanum]
MRVNLEGTKTETSNLEVNTGSELANKFSANASLSATFLGVSAKASGEYEFDTALKTDDFYGVWAMNQTVYSVALKPGDARSDFIDPRHISKILKMNDWDITNTGIRDQWKRFFQTYGTHIIQEVFYCNRYQMRVTSSDTSSLRKERWKAALEADYKGIVSMSAEVANENELSTYRKTKQDFVSIHGGAPGESAILGDDPRNAEKFEAWAKTLNEAKNHNLGNVQIKTIYNLLDDSDNEDHIKAANKIKAPLEHFLGGLALQFTIGLTNTPLERGLTWPKRDPLLTIFALSWPSPSTCDCRISVESAGYGMQTWIREMPGWTGLFIRREWEDDQNFVHWPVEIQIEIPRRKVRVALGASEWLPGGECMFGAYGRTTKTRFTVRGAGALNYVSHELINLKESGEWTLEQPGPLKEWLDDPQIPALAD